LAWWQRENVGGFSVYFEVDCEDLKLFHVVLPVKNRKLEQICQED
jgi:hypothetical protein